MLKATNTTNTYVPSIVSIESIYHKMTQEQSENPVLVIPKKFDSFIKSKLFKMLLRRILEYMQLLEQY